MTGLYDGPSWIAGVCICAIAIASVPLFSAQEGLSVIPQAAAILAVLMAGMSLLRRFPAIHPSVIAYICLVALWGVTYEPQDKVAYLTFVKVGVAALATHILVRTPRHLLLVLGVYCAAGPLTLVINWADIALLRRQMLVDEAWTSELRFVGAFGGANTAGSYGVLVSLCALIVFFNLRHRLRWLLLVCGLGSGLIIGGLSGSRSAMLGLLMAALGAPLMAVAGRPGNVFLKTAKMTALGVVFLGIAFAFLVQLPQFERLQRLERGAEADGSTFKRWELAKETVRVWQAHPIAGAGFRGFRNTSEWLGWSTHTTYGTVLADGGLLGMMLLGVFLLLPAGQLGLFALNSADRTTQRLAVALLVLCFVVVVSATFTGILTRRDLIPMWGAMCGFIQQQRSRASSEKGRQTSRSVLRRRRSLAPMPARAPADGYRGSTCR